MTKLEKLIDALQRGLRVQTGLRDKAASRMRARHEDQQKYEKQAEAVQKEAHQLHRKGHPAKAARKEAVAQDLEAKAAKEKYRAIVYRGRARKLTQRIHKIDTRLETAKKELAELGPKVDLREQVCTGGNFRERWHASNVTSWQRYEEGKRAGRYSQEGVADIHHPYGPGPKEGTRDDCSSYGRSQCLATGADDPSGHDFSPEGFTGDMAEAHGRWKEVSLREMKAAGQGFIIYGSGSGHHTEMFCPTKA
ncbi:MAG: hypothetical protein ACRDPE_17150, partial [Solirubrobacterales bacterium]